MGKPKCHFLASIAFVGWRFLADTAILATSNELCQIVMHLDDKDYNARENNEL
ncbi:hypothetical protein H6G27_33675 [Nostoc linckia FACHB-104]|nr:hypothetical protein [Nostoc linckia FACHB-104]